MKQKNLKIIEIEKLQGIKEEPIVDIGSSLSIWYHKTRKKSLSELTDGDVARFIRQQMYLEYIIPEAVNRLWENPIIGELFDGEVLKTLSEVDKSFWSSNKDLVNEVKRLLDLIKTGKNIPEDFEWLSNEDEMDFYKIIDALNTIINSD